MSGEVAGEGAHLDLAQPLKVAGRQLRRGGQPKALPQSRRAEVAKGGQLRSGVLAAEIGAQERSGRVALALGWQQAGLSPRRKASA